MNAQLDIFENTDLFEEVKKTKELSEKTYNTSENVRKGVFARQNELKNFVIEGFSNLEKGLLEKFLQQEQRINCLEEAIKGK